MIVYLLFETDEYHRNDFFLSAYATMELAEEARDKSKFSYVVEANVFCGDRLAT